MRTHIASVLQRRAKAIRNAVSAYNKIAVTLDPPQSTLDWKTISHFSFIDQFDILRDTCHNVLEKPWAKPLNRELMNRLHRVSRAHEELEHVHIQVRRLHTSIVDEERHFQVTLEQLTDSTIHAPVLDHISRRREVNKLLLSRIHVLYALPEYKGDRTPGKAVNSTGTMEPASQGEGLPSSHPSAESTPLSLGQRPPQFPADESDDDEDGLVLDDEYTEGLEKISEYIGALAL